MPERRDQDPNRTLIKAASGAGLVLLLDKTLNGFLGKLGQELGERLTPNALAVFAHEHVPLVAIFRLHVLVAFAAAAWLQHRRASRIRWHLTIYFGALVFYYWVPGFCDAPIPFDRAPGAAAKDCLFMTLSAALVLAVPARDKIQAWLQYFAAVVLLAVGAVAILGGHSDTVAETVSKLGMLSAAWIGASMIGRVSVASLLAWSIYTFALAFRVEVWTSTGETLGVYAYYWAMFGRVPALIELTLTEERAARNRGHDASSEPDQEDDRYDDASNDRTYRRVMRSNVPQPA